MKKNNPNNFFNMYLISSFDNNETRYLRMLDAENLEKIFIHIKKTPSVFEKIKKEYLCHTDEEIFNKNLIYYSLNDCSISNLLNWGKNILNCFSKLINQYLSLKEKYEIYFFQEDFNNANKALFKIDSNISHSLWGINQKIILSKLDESLKFSYSSKKGNIISLLEHYYYKMADMSVEFSQYNKSIMDLLKTVDNKAYEWKYINYKLNLTSETDIQDLKVALQIDEQISIIDYYETFIYFLQITANRPNVQELSQKIIAELNLKINDYRIRNLNIAFNYDENDISIDDCISNAIEAYTCGNKSELLEELDPLLKKYGSDFNLCSLFVKAGCDISEKRTVFKDLWKEIENIYSINYDIDKSTSVIGKYYKLLYATSWKSKLLNFLSRKLNFFISKNSLIDSILNDITLTPLFYLCIKNTKNKEKYLMKLNNYFPYSIALHRYILSGTIIPSPIKDKIDKTRLSYYEIKKLLISHQYKECILKSLYFLKNIDNKNQYMQERIRRVLFKSYCEANEFSNAMNLYVESYIISNELTLHMDLSVLVNYIEETEDENITSDICRPLIMRFYHKNDNENVISSYLDYLESKDVDSIEDLLNNIKIMTDREVIFFDKVCSQDLLVKDYVSKSKTKKSASDLRASILRNLIIQNNKNKKEYIEELNTIIKSMQLQKKINTFNHNRIFIDKEKLYDFLKDDLHQELSKFKVVQEIIKDIKMINPETEKTLNFLETYWELTSFLKSIISKIQNAYLNNSPYSLENFLSTRIRHNYCKDNLKKEFETYKLFSKKKLDNSMDYTINDYWIKKLSDSDYQIIMIHLSNFSKSIDLKIQEVRDKWIRIKKYEHPEGMFDYNDFPEFFLSYNKYDLSNMIQNPKEFFTEVIVLLDKLTIEILEKIRLRIEVELKPYYNEQLLNLEREVKKCLIDENCKKELLIKIEMSKAKFNNDLENFKNIFFIENEKYPIFSFKDLVEFCCKIEENINTDFSNITINLNDEVLQEYDGKIFPYMVDILGILIKNSVQHSGFNDLTNLIINIDFLNYNKSDLKSILNDQGIIKNEYNTVIKVVNNLSSSVNKSVLRDRIAQKINNIGKQAYHEESIKEGGSGLYKIARTIQYNLGTTATFYGIINDENTNICIAIDLNKFIKED